MEEYKVLKQMLDTLFGSLDLNSWSIFENKNGITTCTLRFKTTKDSDTKPKCESSPVRFKRKSASQQQRDRKRMDTFIRPFTRSQVKPADENVEIIRDDQDHGAISDTIPISPESVSHSTPSTPERLNVCSPPLRVQSSVSPPISDTSTGIPTLDGMELCGGATGGSVPQLSASSSPHTPPSHNRDPPPHDPGDGVGLGELECRYPRVEPNDITLETLLNKPDEKFSKRDLVLGLSLLKF